MNENEIGTEIVGAAITIHRELGPGLMETVYEVVLAHELKERGLQVERQVSVPVEYRGMKFDQGFRADLIIDDRVLIELKSIKKLTAAHRKQIQTYLRLTNMKLGYLLNFGEALMKNGVVRAVNGLQA
jgi:GxxExxY protein